MAGHAGGAVSVGAVPPEAAESTATPQAPAPTAETQAGPEAEAEVTSLDQVRHARAVELLALHTATYCRLHACGANYRLCAVVVGAGRVLNPGYQLASAPVVSLRRSRFVVSHRSKSRSGWSIRRPFRLGRAA